MQFSYLPNKIGLNHPFRYIDGVVVKAGLNDVSSTDYRILKANDTFSSLIEKEAIILNEEKTTKKKNPKPEPQPEPVAVVVEPEIVPTEQVIPNQENSSTENFGKLVFNEAIALVNQTNDPEILKKYLEEENSVGMRVKVVKAINTKLGLLGSEA